MLRLALSLCFVGHVAVAQEIACLYTLECIEGEACTTTEFSLTLRNAAGSEAAMFLVTDAETLTGGGIQRDGPAHAMFAGATAMHLVSIEADHSSRYTVHLQGPMAITYHGSCEAPD